MTKRASVVVAATATLGVFGALMCATGQAAPAGRHTSDAPLPVATEEDTEPTEPEPIRPTPPVKAPDGPSTAPAVSAPTQTPTHPGEAAKQPPTHHADKKPKHGPKHKPKHKPKSKPSKRPKSPLRKGLERVLPDTKHIPDWALPIVGEVQNDAVPGTQVQAYMDGSGKLVVRAQVVAKHGYGYGVLPRVSTNDHAPVSGVDVRLVVENPTTASKGDPSRVTVTATDPQTAETVTRTAKVTAPDAVANVTDSTMHTTVNQAADATPARVNT
jgi:hypothetical protein